MADLQQIAVLARDVRKAQKRFFATRDNLYECKDLEAQLDRALKDHFEPPSLFDGGDGEESGC